MRAPFQIGERRLVAARTGGGRLLRRGGRAGHRGRFVRGCGGGCRRLLHDRSAGSEDRRYDCENRSKNNQFFHVKWLVTKVIRNSANV